MAIITTTIKEPKTFQQIQAQQNELEKQNALESLNNNIAKLITTINDKKEKKETEQDRQLKMNQLELSKLQLRRAQLGLARDEKYYTDYSRRWNEKNSTIGYSIGLDKDKTDKGIAMGLSALTAGALNPVVVKEMLIPMFKPIWNISKALAAFPGILPMMFRRISGKSSSAVSSDKDRRLHGKLDQILSAIKNKVKGDKKEKEEKEGLLSKLLKMLVLGAAGLALASAALGGDEGLIKNTLVEHGKAMLAGFVLGGWKGALVGLALDVFAKTVGIIPKETDKPTIIDVAADNARQKIEKWAHIKISDTQFKLAVAGMMIAGPKGMLAGYILGNDKVRKAIKAFNENGFEGLKDLADRTILEMTQGTALQGIPPEVIEGAIAGAAAGSRFGIKGFVSGAILGAAGGFAWDRYKNATIPEKAGINTRFDFSKGDFVINGTDKTYSDFLEPLLLEKIKDKDGNSKPKYTREEAEKLAIENIKKYLEDNKIDNKEQTIGETISNVVKTSAEKSWKFIKDHPLEIAGLTGLTLGIKILSGLIDGTGIQKAITNFGLIGTIAGLIVIGNDLYKTLKGEDEVDEYIKEHQKELENLPVSEQINKASGQVDGKRIAEGIKKIAKGNFIGLKDVGVGIWGALKNAFKEAGAFLAETIVGQDDSSLHPKVPYTLYDKYRLIVSDLKNKTLTEEERIKLEEEEKKLFNQITSPFEPHIRENFDDPLIPALPNLPNYKRLTIANELATLGRNAKTATNALLHFIMKDGNYDRIEVVQEIEKLYSEDLREKLETIKGSDEANTDATEKNTQAMIQNTQQQKEVLEVMKKRYPAAFGEYNPTDYPGLQTFVGSPQMTRVTDGGFVYGM